MIEGKTLQFLNDDNVLQQRCAGSTGPERCSEVCSVNENPKLVTIPYICLNCTLRGWRNRLDKAYAPGEAF